MEMTKFFDVRIQFFAVRPTRNTVAPGERLIGPSIIDESNATVKHSQVVFLRHRFKCRILK
jgi:hypothetical protein